VWVELSIGEELKKIWGVINQDLQPGDYTVFIENSILVMILNDFLFRFQ